MQSQFSSPSFWGVTVVRKFVVGDRSSHSSQRYSTESQLFIPEKSIALKINLKRNLC